VEFLEGWAKKQEKVLKIVSKDELNKLKTVRKPENHFYVKKKVAESILYKVVTIPGTFYNSYRIEKFGKVNIEEISHDKIQMGDKVKMESKSILDTTPLLDELKDVLSKRPPCHFSLVSSSQKRSNDFVNALIKQKELLRKLE
jgi:hypothetical protein